MFKKRAFTSVPQVSILFIEDIYLIFSGLNIPHGTRFWTSGLSDKCTNSFGWCTGKENEFLNTALLGLDKFDSTNGAECVTATFENSDNKTNFALQADICDLLAKRRVICEVMYDLFSLG
jgi:hypothetical protein